MKPCLKQTVKCIIVREDGRKYEGTNHCDVEDQCIRVKEGCKSGEGYELCGSIHAEVDAAYRAAESKETPGVAYVMGHSYACDNCKEKLAEVGVDKVYITKPI